MANRHPAPVHVPSLGQKINVLFREAKQVRAMKQLAGKLGVSEKAVRGWIKGTQARGPEMVPGARFKPLAEIFASQFPVKRPYEEAAALLLNGTPTDVLAAFVMLPPQAAWVRVLADTPVREIRLIPVQIAGAMRLTTRARPRRDLDANVMHSVRHPFQLRLTCPFAGWVAGVQCGRGGCHALDIGDGAIAPAGKGEFLLPTVEPDFREDEQGLRRFLFLAARTPFPEDVAAALRASALTQVPLDANVLERIAQLAKSDDGWRWSALDVQFYDPLG